MTSKRLGRGLDFLISSRDKEEQAGLIHLSIADIKSNRFQPRVHFDEQKIEELAQSIRTNGVIQPILVRKTGDSYELIAGERRIKASLRAGKRTIPAVLLDIPDDQLLDLALIENLQREDLDPIEEAQAFHRMVSHRGMSHEEIGEIVGKHRSHVSNSLRLLDLPEKIRDHVSRGTIEVNIVFNL